MHTLRLSSAKTIRTNILDSSTVQAFKNRGAFQYLVAVKTDSGYRHIKADGTKIDTWYEGYSVADILKSINAAKYHLTFEQSGDSNHVTGFIIR